MHVAYYIDKHIELTDNLKISNVWAYLGYEVDGGCPVCRRDHGQLRLRKRYIMPLLSGCSFARESITRLALFV